MGHTTSRFNDDFRAPRARYELSPAEAAFSRSTFDELAKIHREGTEAPLIAPDPQGPDTEPEEFELDGESTLALTLQDELGRPLADQPVHLTSAAGLVRTARTDAQGRIRFTGLEAAGMNVVLPGLDADSIRIAERVSDE
jgi:hypothetical protein